MVTEHPRALWAHLRFIRRLLAHAYLLGPGGYVKLSQEEAKVKMHLAGIKRPFP